MAISLLLAMLGSVLCSTSFAQERGTAERIRITYAANNLGLLHMFVAKDRGFYAGQGLDVELIRASTVAGMGALLSGDAEYTQFLGSAMRVASKGAPVRGVSMAIGAPFFSVAARTRFKNMKELKGGTIGVTAIGGSNYVSTRMLLQHYGLEPDRDVKLFVIGDHAALYEALKIGRVDAVTVNPPFSVLLKREGYPLLAHSAGIIDFPLAGIATTLGKINQSRAQVKKVLRAELQALRYIHKQAPGTMELIQKRFAMDQSVAAESYRLVIDAFTQDGKLSVQGVERLLDVGKIDGSIGKNVTVDQVVDFSLAEEAFKELGSGQ